MRGFQNNHFWNYWIRVYLFVCFLRLYTDFNTHEFGYLCNIFRATRFQSEDARSPMPKQVAKKF